MIGNAAWRLMPVIPGGEVCCRFEYEVSLCYRVCSSSAWVRIRPFLKHQTKQERMKWMGFVQGWLKCQSPALKKQGRKVQAHCWLTPDSVLTYCCVLLTLKTSFSQGGYVFSSSVWFLFEIRFFCLDSCYFQCKMKYFNSELDGTLGTSEEVHFCWYSQSHCVNELSRESSLGIPKVLLT